MLQNIRTVQCTEINAARQGRGECSFPARHVYTILDQRSIRPVSRHGILGRFVYLRRSLN